MFVQGASSTTLTLRLSGVPVGKEDEAVRFKIIKIDEKPISYELFFPVFTGAQPRHLLHPKPQIHWVRVTFFFLPFLPFLHAVLSAFTLSLSFGGSQTQYPSPFALVTRAHQCGTDFNICRADWGPSYRLLVWPIGSRGQAILKRERGCWYAISFPWAAELKPILSSLFFSLYLTGLERCFRQHSKLISFLGG